MDGVILDLTKKLMKSDTQISRTIDCPCISIQGFLNPNIMKQYTTDKHLGKMKFKDEKINRKTLHKSRTEASKLEAKNANRSRKKAVRQKSKKEIQEDLDTERYGETYSSFEDIGF